MDKLFSSLMNRWNVLGRFPAVVFCMFLWAVFTHRPAKEQIIYLVGYLAFEGWTIRKIWIESRQMADIMTDAIKQYNASHPTPAETVEGGAPHA